MCFGVRREVDIGFNVFKVKCLGDADGCVIVVCGDAD